MHNKVIKLFIIIAAFIALLPNRALAQDTAPDLVKVVDSMEQAFSKVDSYAAVFVKQERVGGSLLPQETVDIKFKKPFMVYMRWLKGPHEGREALYVQGRYGNKVVGHDGGLLRFITLHMEPTGTTAMKGNRHPITDVGIGRLIEIVTSNFRRAQKESALEARYRGTLDVYGRPAYSFEAVLPREKDRGYYARRIELWVDRGYGLPTKILVYGWDGELLESYEYRDIRLDTGLTDGDFDEKNPGYGF